MSENRLKTWKEIPRGGNIIEPGNSHNYHTGSWRAYRPLWDEEKCVHCLKCWILCPDSSILVKEEKVTNIDLDHCKGCGICARECPVQAIEMKLEGECQ